MDSMRQLLSLSGKLSRGRYKGLLTPEAEAQLLSQIDELRFEIKMQKLLEEMPPLTDEVKERIREYFDDSLR